jgi:hypothetical protein
VSFGAMAEQFGTFGLALLSIALLIVWRRVRSLQAKVGRLGKEVDQLHQQMERLFFVSLHGNNAQASRQEQKVTAGGLERTEVVRLKPAPIAP